MGAVKCYLFDHIPGAGWNGWTLAVLAAGRKDADRYMSCHYCGGNYKFKGEAGPGKVTADCGATTETAQEIIHQQEA